MMKTQFMLFSFVLIIEGGKLQSSGRSIIVSSSPTINQNNYVVKYVNEELYLTCFNSDISDNRIVEWILPPLFSIDNYDRVSFSRGLNGSLTLSVSQLSENDTGEYKCTLYNTSQTTPCNLTECPNQSNSDASAMTAISSVHLFVKKKSCSGLKCPITDICISQRYVCDGYPDCLNKEDESEVTCGSNPCLGKIKCPNKRCIPESWCCKNNENCTTKWDVNCCPDNVKNSTYLGSPQHYNDGLLASMENQRDLSSFTRLLYGCVFVLVVIGAIALIAGCQLVINRQLYRGYCSGGIFPQGPMQARRRTHYPDLCPIRRGCLRTSVASVDDSQCCNYMIERVCCPNMDSLPDVPNTVRNVDEPPPAYCELFPFTDCDNPPPPYASPPTSRLRLF